jgi:hypothetical protein
MELKNTHILRLNEGMLRDCWWEVVEDKEHHTMENIFVLRQVNLADHISGQAKVKEFRLSEGEATELYKILREKHGIVPR